MNLAVNPVAFSTSSVSWKSGDGVSDQFPAGLRVLVVDDDPTCLRILEKMLKNCLYEVTKCSRAEVALKLLRDNKDGFDIVISDVHMPDMDGFKLLEHVGLEMDLPVIMMSADDSKNVVMKGVTHGACDYLIKPVRMEALKNIWQHVVRKKKYEWKEKDNEQSGSFEDGERNQKPQSEDADYSSSANEGHNWKSSKKRKDEEDDGGDERDDTSNMKKPRVVWSIELHQQFVSAVNQLGIDKAVPKKILELMNVPGLTRENVASHLQKYRLYLKRLSGQHHGGLANSFMCTTDPTFGLMTPLNGLDFQALASSSQIPPQSLATIQASALNRAPTNRPAISGAQMDQKNIFSFESPRIRFTESQQQHNNNRQVNLLHGIPTNMDTKQLAAFHQSAQPFGNVSLPIHPQPRNQILNQPIFSQAIPSTSAVLIRNGVDNVRGQTYASASQPSPLVEFSRSQGSDIRGNRNINNNNNNSFSLMGNGGITSTSNFDAFSNNKRTDQWGLSGFDIPQNTSTQVAPSVLVQPSGFSAEQRSGHSEVPSVVNNRLAFLAGEGIGSINNTNPGLINSNNTLRVRAERLPDTGFQNSLFPDQFDQEDLISAIFRQQQGGTGPGENDFGFDGYHLDNLPV